MGACDDLPCNNCPIPGRCCTGLTLTGSADGSWPPPGETTLEAYIALASMLHLDCNGRPMLGSPWLPFMQRETGEWLLWCMNLEPGGRCGDHPNRPMTCKSYTAGTDFLCALYTPSMGDLPSLDGE
jgi:Fe-S-cluster containining protein